MTRRETVTSAGEGPSLGMFVPMELTPAAALIGAGLGAIMGWRSASWARQPAPQLCEATFFSDAR